MIPKGYQFAGVHCGIKSDPNKPDLSLIVSDRPATAAGVYTQNLVFAAPVKLDRERTPRDDIRTVVINSGNANACTGQKGYDDAKLMAKWAADVLAVKDTRALVMSTGIIGEFLPMDKIEFGIHRAATQLEVTEEAFEQAARGILTTDTVTKTFTRAVTLDDHGIVIAGMAKGAAMIGPNMATMLGLIVTDAFLDPIDAQKVLAAAVDETFNCISVDGHTSTNDTVLLLANGASNERPLKGKSLNEFGDILTDLCADLAKSIPADGEGATHLVTIKVTGCQTTQSARQIAKTVADSPLVKTAIAGADPNWGRIVSAAGYSGVKFNPSRVSLWVNGFALFDKGTPVRFDAIACSENIRAKRDTLIELEFGEGRESARFWTTDLTTDYVKLNADYHT